MTNQRPTVLIAEPIACEPKAWLGERCRVVEVGVDGEGFAEALGAAEGLVVRTYTRVDRGLLDRAPKLRVVGRAGVGVDNIDLVACAARGVVVVNMPHANAMAVVEYVISVVMTTLRPIRGLDDSFDAGRWHAVREEAISAGSVVGTTLGIVGFGYIGSRVGRAGGALGMRVGFADVRRIESDVAGEAASRSFEELLGESRCVCVHVDGRAENRGLIGDEAFGLMREDVVFVNASRGFVVDPGAAARFAVANPGARLILDVHDPEPIEAGSGLLGLENVMLTAHIAAATREAKRAMSWVVKDVWAVLDGGEPIHAWDGAGAG